MEIGSSPADTSVIAAQQAAALERLNMLVDWQWLLRSVSLVRWTDLSYWCVGMECAHFGNPM